MEIKSLHTHVDIVTRSKGHSVIAKAAYNANYELLDLYWTLGEYIVKNQEQHSWGDAFIKSLAKDLQKEFPDMKGFSETNIKYIRRWYSFYMKGLQDVAEIENNDSNSKGLQAVAQFDERVINHIKQISWGHNQRIINKCKTIDEAIYYVNKTIENGWSRNILEHQIESGLYGREGKSITNFEKRLPALQSDLARQTLKDPYHFDFLTIREGYDERELQKELVDEISDFLLELGEGFAYIGKEYHLNINGDDFYIDLLFYNLKLHSYIVIELKAEKFKPEHLGQLNFYVTAVNRELKTDRDNATIAPIDNNTKKVKKFNDWTLNDFINSAYELRIINEDVKKFSHVVREFRNYIHPYQQLCSKFTPDKHTALICLQVLKALIAQIGEYVKMNNIS